MTEQTEDRLRRVDVTYNGITERYFAARSDDDPKLWLLFSAADWIDADLAAWAITEGPKEFDGDNGERISLWGQAPPNTSWKWIDAAPTPDAYEELKKVYREEYGEDPDD